MNFYFDAAKALDRLDARQGSVKSVLSFLPEKDRKRTAALVIETLKYKHALTDVIAAAGLMKAEKQKLTSLNLTLLLVHDILFSKGIQAGDGPIKQAVLRHKTRLNAELQKIKIKKGVKSNQDLAQTGDARAEMIPRYVRVNTHLWTVKDALAYYTTKGYAEAGDPCSSLMSIKRDDHVPDLLLFHPTTSFENDKMFAEGRIILQDKASCFPAIILAPPADTAIHVIDATAAPGNKTSYLSAIMRNNGQIFAFERDIRRFATLQRMLSKAKCTNVEALDHDFLKIDPMDKKYSRVSHILLDPSCSGSGIVNRLDYLLDSEHDDDNNEERLHKLAVFQLSMIKHAMKFPNVTKIVYSTCSIHAIENEEVVCAALVSQEARERRFVLAPRHQVLPEWPRRGEAKSLEDACIPADAAESLVRCDAGQDRTNGFFVSCFLQNGTDGKDAVQKAVSPPALKRAVTGNDRLPSDRPKKKRKKP